MSTKFITPDGKEIPAKYVPSIDKKKNRLALQIAKKAQAMQEKTKTFKDALITSADSLYDEMLKDAKVKPSYRKGNYTITSFDRSTKLEINVNDRIEFDDSITFAKAKLDEYLKSKTAGVDEDLAKIVNLAFHSTKGTMDTKRILDLFSLQIKNPIWNEAMDLIKKSMKRNVSKRYVRIYVKDEEGKYQPIELNFSAL